MFQHETDSGYYSLTEEEDDWCALCKHFEDNWKTPWKESGILFSTYNPYRQLIPYFHNPDTYHTILGWCNTYEKLYRFYQLFQQPNTLEEEQFWIQFGHHLKAAYDCGWWCDRHPSELLLKRPRITIRELSHNTLDLTQFHGHFHL